MNIENYKKVNLQFIVKLTNYPLISIDKIILYAYSQMAMAV